MSLYSYFAEASKQSDLPNLNGSVSPTTIKEANEAVTRERASREGVTLSSNLCSSCNRMPLYTATKRLLGTSLSSWV